MPCRNQCRLYIHPAFTYILRWSLKRSVKRTWTGSGFSTNESAWSVMVTCPQSCVWSGPYSQFGCISYKKTKWRHICILYEQPHLALPVVWTIESSIMVDLLSFSTPIVQSHCKTPLSGARSWLQALPYITRFRPMHGENRLLVTYEPIEFEK